MSDETLRFSVPTDDDGFISLQCPYCEDTFKLSASESADDDILQIYCPYCGLPDVPSNFVTDDVKEQALITAKNLLFERINGMTRDLERNFRGNPMITFKATSLELETDKPLFETNDDYEQIQHESCRRCVKVHAVTVKAGAYCPYCGVK